MRHPRPCDPAGILPPLAIQPPLSCLSPTFPCSPTPNVRVKLFRLASGDCISSFNLRALAPHFNSPNFRQRSDTSQFSHPRISFQNALFHHIPDTSQTRVALFLIPASRTTSTPSITASTIRCPFVRTSPLVLYSSPTPVSSCPNASHRRPRRRPLRLPKRRRSQTRTQIRSPTTMHLPSLPPLTSVCSLPLSIRLSPRTLQPPSSIQSRSTSSMPS